MTLLITADLHLSDNPRDDYRWRIFAELRRIILQHNVNCLVVLGDLTEEKDRHTAKLVNRVADEFSAIAGMCDVVVLKGNHDYIREDDPFFGFLQHTEGIRYVGEPEFMGELGGFPYGGKRGIALLPHSPDPVRGWSGLDLHAGLVLCHQTFDGSRSSHGHVLQGLSPQLFSDDQIVVSGDVHVPQRVGPVRYVGAPYTIDFGDSYQPRLILIDRERRLLSQRLQLPGKRQLDIASAVDLKGLAVTKGDVLQIRLPNDPRPELRRELQDWAKRQGVDLHSCVAQKRERTRLKLVGKEEDTRRIREYAERNGQDPEVGLSFVK